MDERDTSATNEYAVHTSKLCGVSGSLRAVDDLEVRVAPGTLCGFLGRNGAGVWSRHVLLHEAETLPAAEERILEAVNTPVD